MFQTTAAILSQLIEGLTDEEIARKPAPDRFSIAEVLAHLEHVERAYGERIRLLFEKNHPAFNRYQPPADGAPGEIYGRDALVSFTKQRDDNLEYLAEHAVDPATRTGTHNIYGEMTLENVLAEISYHDLGHIRQVAELVRWLRFYPKMGPFQKEYTVKP